MKRLIFLLIGMVFIFSGCYDMKEVSDELYAIILAVDKSGDGIKLTAAVPDYSSKEEYVTEIRSIEAKDMSEGLDKLNHMMSRKISLLHLKVVVFSEDIARDGLIRHAGAIQKHMETRNAMGVMISSCSASELVSLLCDNTSGDISSELEVLLLSNRYNSFCPVVLFEDFYNNMTSNYRSSYAVYAGNGDEIIQGIALFDSDRMSGVLNKRESAYFMMASGKLKGGLMTFETKDGDVSVDITGRKSKISVDDAVNIDVSLDGKMVYTAHMSHVKDEIESEIKNGIISVVRKSSAAGCDILGINGYAARNYATIDKWKKHEPDFENIIVSIKLGLSQSVNG